MNLRMTKEQIQKHSANIFQFTCNSGQVSNGNDDKLLVDHVLNIRHLW